MADEMDSLTHMELGAPIGCGDVDKLRKRAQRTGDAQLMRDIEITQRMRRVADMGMDKKRKKSKGCKRRKKGM